jgi:hypothetical protein
MPEYEESYIRHIAGGSGRSAAHVVPILQLLLHVESVADFGCGSGTWLSAWRSIGIEDICGIDGPYLTQRSLVIPAKRFVAADLAAPIKLGRRFDLAMSLEVAEHLPAQAAATFVETLANHAPIVLFSAAPPGQGGEHHINERPYAYWRQLFSTHGYSVLDAVRPRIAGNTQIEPWYRYNTLLFVDDAIMPALPPSLTAQRVHDDAEIEEYAPLLVRLRSRLVSWIPPSAVTRVAVATRRWQQRSQNGRPRVGLPLARAADALIAASPRDSVGSGAASTSTARRTR